MRAIFEGLVDCNGEALLQRDAELVRGLLAGGLCCGWIDTKFA